MRNISRPALFAFALMFLFGGIAVQDADAQIMTKILQTMDGHKKALQSLKSNVKYTEYESSLKEESEKSGSVSYVPRPGRDAWVRIDWVKPDETLIVASGKYVLYRKRMNQAIVGKVEGSKTQGQSNALKFMSMSKSELENSYSPEYIGLETIDGTETWRIKLTPKGADSFKDAELWVDGNGMPIQALIREKNKDEKTIRLSSVKKNQVIDAVIFKFDPKSYPGIKIIDG